MTWMGVAELRWTSWGLSVWLGVDAAALCSKYVSPEACRLLLAVSMGSIYMWGRSGMPTMMDKAMASLGFIPSSG